MDDNVLYEVKHQTIILSAKHLKFNRHMFFYTLIAKLCPTFLLSQGLDSTRFLCSWDFPGNNTGVSCHFLFQGIFLTQGSNPRLPCLLHCGWILYHRATREAPQLSFLMEKPKAKQYTSKDPNPLPQTWSKNKQKLLKHDKMISTRILRT